MCFCYSCKTGIAKNNTFNASSAEAADLQGLTRFFHRGFKTLENVVKMTLGWDLTSLEQYSFNILTWRGLRIKKMFSTVQSDNL